MTTMTTRWQTSTTYAIATYMDMHACLNEATSYKLVGYIALLFGPLYSLVRGCQHL